MLKVPYERFLRYLVSRKVEVNTALQKIGLPSIGDMWQPRERTRLKTDAPRTVLHYLESEQLHVIFKDDFLSWAKTHEIDTIWSVQPEFVEGTPSDTFEQARKLFFSPLTRTILGMLLLSDIAEEEIGPVLLERCKVVLAPPVLALYRHIFWDIPDTNEMFWARENIERFGDDQKYYLATACQEPRPALAEIRYILGLSTRHEPDQVLRGIMEQAYSTFLRTMVEPDPESNGALRWAELARGAAKDLSGVVAKTPKEDADPSDHFHLFSIKVEKKAIPTMADIQGEISQPVAATAEKK